MLRAMGRGAVVAVIVAWGWVVAGMVFVITALASAGAAAINAWMMKGGH